MAIYSNCKQPQLNMTASIVVKDLRLKDEDKDEDLMSKVEDKDKEVRHVSHGGTRQRTSSSAWDSMIHRGKASCWPYRHGAVPRESPLTKTSAHSPGRRTPLTLQPGLPLQHEPWLAYHQLTSSFGQTGQ